VKFLPKYSVENPVLVGIIMILTIAAGIFSSLSLVREMFPESRPNQIMIRAPYPGATPSEVEKGLALRIEEAVKDVDYVERITSQISEGVCVVNVELESGTPNLDQSVNDVKAAIDSIPRDELPEEAEEITVARAEPRLPVIAVTAFGDMTEEQRKQLGERLRSELLRLPSVTDLDLGGTRPREITVEIEPERLIEFGLSLSAVADAIRQSNLDVPAGQVKTSAQNVSIRTLGETDDARSIAATIVRTRPDGSTVRIADLGTVTDGFVEADSGGRFNGQPGVSATVYKTSRQDAIEIADIVKAYAAAKDGKPLPLDASTRLKNAFGIETEAQRVYREAANNPLPEGVRVVTHSNLARFIEDRLDLLTRNGLMGLALVFLSLLLFLNWRVAFWVMMGLVVAVCGSIVLMQALGATLNLISMFGLIVVLGLIVDDAIVVAENVYARIERGESPHEAAIKGAQEVTWPVIVAVGTTIGAFLPLLFIEGRIGDFMGVLPVVVTCALTMSLLESLSILPSHLAESLRPIPRNGTAPAPRSRAGRLIARIRNTEQHFLLHHLSTAYEWLLHIAVRHRYVTVAAMVALLIVAGGLVGGARVPFVFIQKMDSETMLADLDMPVGTPVERTMAAMKVVEQAALDMPEVETVWAIFGAQLDADESGAYATERSHLAQLIIELKPIDQRERSSDAITADMRARTANIPGVNSLRYRSMQGGPAGAEIEIEVTGDRIEDILAATGRLQTQLAEFAGVYDIADDYEEGRRELRIELLDSARALGLSTRWLAQEVRGAFYGIDARTLQRGREDVDIRVRYPRERARRISEVETMRIVTPTGTAVPLREVARVVEGRGTASIRRVDQRRAVVVSADVDQNEGNAEQIQAAMKESVLDLEGRYPGLGIRYAGNKEETTKSFSSLGRDFMVAIVIIYFMLAGLFRSYVQPVVVLTAIPFGIIGAVAGHLLMGYPLTILSMIGLVALTGIVVNDSLIMVDFINREIGGGRRAEEAVVSAAIRRLRPILLTSLTTILGLAPLMLETSFQARFLIPMAISLSFGLAFATVLTLIVVPANYLIMLDVFRLARRTRALIAPPAPSAAG